MNRIFLIISLLLVTSISFAFTQTDVANCKARVNASYDSNCNFRTKADNSATVYNNPTTQCAAGYSQALINCQNGFMVVYRHDMGFVTNGQHHGNIENHYSSLVKNTWDWPGEAIKFPIAAVPGMPFIKQCYWQPAYQFKGFPSKDGLCGTEPETNFVLTQHLYDPITDQWYTKYNDQKPHIMGFSYSDTTVTTPVYKCQGVYTNYQLQNPKNFFFISRNASCLGYNNLGVMGYGAPFPL